MNNQNEDKVLLEDKYKPSDELLEAIYDVYDKFAEWKAIKSNNYRQFGGTNLSSWLQNSRDKFYGYSPVSEDGQKFFFQETRNQITELLSRIANLRTRASFEGVEGFDILKSTLLNDLFHHWSRHAKRVYRNFRYYLYAVINGTVIVYVGFRHEKKKRESVTKYDDETGEMSWKMEDVEVAEVEEQLCNLEDIFFPKIWEPDIQKQGEIIWREMITKADFDKRYGQFKNSEHVFEGSMLSDQSIFAELISPVAIDKNLVEVIRYYNSDDNKYMIIANGVLLNPAKKNGKDVIGPMPWNHGQLPFGKEIFEFIDSQFFFGMSMGQKVSDPQKALNDMWELLIDREKKAIARPILTNDPSMEEGVEFKAGHVYQVGADVQAGYRELEMGSASSSYWNALGTLQGIIDRTGSGGVEPIQRSRQPESATAHRVSYQKERTISGMYYLSYEHLLEQISWLAVKNMIQFYSSSIVRRALGERKFNYIFALNDIRLVGGGNGNREVRVTDKPKPNKELQEEAMTKSLLKKEKVEIIEVTPQQLHDLSFDIKIAFDEELTPEGEQAMFMDWSIMMMNLFGQQGLVDPKKLAFRNIEKMRESPADIMPDELLGEYEMERFGVRASQPQQQQQVPGGMPQLNRFNQGLRGERYGAQGPQAREEGAGPARVPDTKQIY